MLGNPRNGRKRQHAPRRTFIERNLNKISMKSQKHAVTVNAQVFRAYIKLQ